MGFNEGSKNDNFLYGSLHLSKIKQGSPRTTYLAYGKTPVGHTAGMLRGRVHVGVDVRHCIADGRDLLCVFVADFAAE